jgi:7-cyano-7-deazaguanine reductase
MRLFEWGRLTCSRNAAHMGDRSFRSRTVLVDRAKCEASPPTSWGMSGEETMKGKQKKTKLGYNERHAKSGITATLPDIETFPNQYKGYEITIEIPEYTAICPKTGLPDFGTITVHYMPDRECLELKSLKIYIHAYRNIGIFYENSVNRILNDIATACHPVWAKVTGTFAARGGLRSVIEARYP